MDPDLMTNARQLSAMGSGIAPGPGSGMPLARDARTERLLRGPVLGTLVRLAGPNVLMTTAQASTGLIETYFIAHLGTDALAGMALVFPMLMLVQMISAGAVGGGMLSAVSRALGGGRLAEANGLVWNAVAIALGLGVYPSPPASRIRPVRGDDRRADDGCARRPVVRRRPNEMREQCLQIKRSPAPSPGTPASGWQSRAVACHGVRHRPAHRFGKVECVRA